jgi:hypothetical protein
MRKTTSFIPVGLVSVGLTLSLGSATFAEPSARYGLRDRHSGALHLNRVYYLHERIYDEHHNQKEVFRRKAPEPAPGPGAPAGRESAARPRPASAW